MNDIIWGPPVPEKGGANDEPLEEVVNGSRREEEAQRVAQEVRKPQPKSQEAPSLPETWQTLHRTMTNDPLSFMVVHPLLKQKYEELARADKIKEEQERIERGLAVRAAGKPPAQRGR